MDRLLEEKFGVKDSKHFQKADWGVRPLSPDLLLYAAQDTHYLIPLRDLLEAELREKGLLELAQEDFRMACNHQRPRPSEAGTSRSWLRMRARARSQAAGTDGTEGIAGLARGDGCAAGSAAVQGHDDDRLIGLLEAAAIGPPRACRPPA